MEAISADAGLTMRGAVTLLSLLGVLVAFSASAAAAATPTIGRVTADKALNTTQSGDVPVNCVWCQFVVELLEKQVQTKLKSEKELETGLMVICELVVKGQKPPPVNCTTLVPPLAQAIWKGEHTSPKDVCARFMPCSSTEQREEVLGIFGAGEDSGILCGLCQGIIGYLKNLVLDNADTLEKDIILTFCDHLPPSPAKGCADGITKDFSGIVTRLLDADKICRAVSLCEN